MSPAKRSSTRSSGPTPRYSVADVVGWLLQLCAGLEYMHSYRDPATGQLRPVIHRDVKPLNVVLTPEGRIKLLDMGIARFAVPGQATARAARAVTEPFAPIEQYGAGTDARSDLYALGVTAYVLLTRQLPPSAPERVASPQDLRVRAINRTVPPGVAAAIERAMMPRPEARFPTIEAFRRALESGWVAEDRLDEAARPDTSGLWGTIRRVFVGPGPASGAPPAPAPAGNLTLAERLVEWRSRSNASASLEVILSLERGMGGPAQLRLAAEICQRGRRGRLTQQRIALEERDARAFAARLGELTRSQRSAERRDPVRGRADHAARNLGWPAQPVRAGDSDQRAARRGEVVRDRARSPPGRGSGIRATDRAAAGEAGLVTGQARRVAAYLATIPSSPNHDIHASNEEERDGARRPDRRSRTAARSAPYWPAWLLANAIGGLSLAAGVALRLLVQLNIPDLPPSITIGSVSRAGFGLAQWFVLRRTLPRPALWVLAALLAGIGQFMLVLIDGELLTPLLVGGCQALALAPRWRRVGWWCCLSTLAVGVAEIAALDVVSSTSPAARIVGRTFEDLLLVDHPLWLVLDRRRRELLILTIPALGLLVARASLQPSPAVHSAPDRMVSC